ncbi:MAG: hypothetical protein R6V86_06150 [Spirochaetia bacterium]
MKFSLVTIILILVLSIPTPAGTREKESAPVSQAHSATRPVYLVYGIAYQNVDFLMQSLQKVQQALLHDGVPSFITEKDAFASIAENARMMKHEVLEYLAEHPNYTQIDIIAHSKGGLEARYMISRLDMAEYVASLTTLSTPHRGTPVAEFITEDAGEGGRIIATTVANAVGTLLGDSNPDSDRAFHQLTPGYIDNFNRKTPNHPSVYYLSFASQIGEEYPSLLYRTIGGAIHATAGPNDGFVPVESAKWGDFRGLVCTIYGHEGLSHSDIIGGNPLTYNVDFDFVRFFKDIVEIVQ